MSYPQGNLDFTFSSTDASLFPQPGTCVPTDDGLKMVCVYNAGASAIAAGDVVGVFATYARGSVSTTGATMLDFDDAADIVSHVAGVAVGAIAAAAYGWLWAQGASTTLTITTDDSIAAGDGLVLDDGLKVATTQVATNAHGHFGFSHAADGGTTMTGGTLTKTAFLY